VFEPFFTTKANGNGSDPGLSETREIIEDHGGSITVESEPGKGSVFQLSLPLAVTGADSMLGHNVSASRGAKLVL
jgi:signal transduction histidine kinase